MNVLVFCDPGLPPRSLKHVAGMKFGVICVLRLIEFKKILPTQSWESSSKTFPESRISGQAIANF